ncbi:NAD(P)H-dependent oxidoreductase [Opitutaceae bacterium EW11]|nr:NAD(P)H-dependent oxidoreductase [Opitutaceae bacterium EW11]
MPCNSSWRGSSQPVGRDGPREATAAAGRLDGERRAFASSAVPRLASGVTTNPPRVSASELLASLRWRYATKRFDPVKKIPDETWKALEEALILSPSSYGLQPWKFLVVRDLGVREKLQAHAWGQTQVTECSHFVVFAVRRDLGAEHVDHYLDRIVEVRKVSRETLTGFRKLLVTSLEQAAAKGRLNEWQTHQVYIALGQFMASAALLGVDTCPMEGLAPERFDEVLALAGTGYRTVVACAAGYRGADDKYSRYEKVRFAAKDVIVHV